MSDNVKQAEWGYEVTWASTDDYCGKLLVFEKSNKTLPLHFHKEKSKSWFVNAGKFKVQWLDTKTGESFATELDEGGVFHVPALMPVTVESLLDNSVMAETSNRDADEDYYRLG
jgi:mannose-6-phosphate isomerase-like protein (cupin superfamily)